MGLNASRPGPVTPETEMHSLHLSSSLVHLVPFFSASSRLLSRVRLSLFVFVARVFCVELEG